MSDSNFEFVLNCRYCAKRSNKNSFQFRNNAFEFYLYFNRIFVFISNVIAWVFPRNEKSDFISKKPKKINRSVGLWVAISIFFNQLGKIWSLSHLKFSGTSEMNLPTLSSHVPPPLIWISYSIQESTRKSYFQATLPMISIRICQNVCSPYSSIVTF